MNYKKAYRCKADLKMLREEMNLSKEFVANEIGYSVRNLERIEKIMQLLAKKQRVEYVHFINLNMSKLL